MRSSVGIVMLVGQLGSRLIDRGLMSPRLEREEGARKCSFGSSSCRLKTLSFLCSSHSGKHKTVALKRIGAIGPGTYFRYSSGT